MKRADRWTRSFLGCVAGLGAATGCGADISGSILVSPTGNAPPPDTVAVVFRNRSDTDAVDVQFYASNLVLQDVTQELFVDANKVVASIGVAGTGIIQPGDADIIDLPCATDLSLGTLGGRFLDNETGELSGEGVTRWAQERPLGLCGAVVIFEFSAPAGVFSTEIRLMNVDDVAALFGSGATQGRPQG